MFTSQAPGFAQRPFRTHGVAAAPSFPGKHHVEVLREVSGGSGRVTSGQAVCLTCHWEGPRRSGASADALETDAAAHASTTSGRWSCDFIGG